MSIEGNIQVISRLFDEVFNNRNIQVIDEFIADDVISHEVTGIVRTPGLEGFKGETKMFLDAFPDAVITAEDIIA